MSMVQHSRSNKASICAEGSMKRGLYMKTLMKCTAERHVLMCYCGNNELQNQMYLCLQVGRAHVQLMSNNLDNIMTVVCDIGAPTPRFPR